MEYRLFNQKFKLKICKTSKIGLSMDSLNAAFFQFSATIIKNFVLSS